MKLGVFLSEFRAGSEVVNRLTADKLGIILVGNAVYHAAVKENGQSSPLLEKSANFYALSEDLQTRGLSLTAIDSRVKVVNYRDVVDLIFNDYEKLAWL